MAAPMDDLPWPELGNVSRGATRGNQGFKGQLGPPNEHGQCMLQLRVQPGVLAVLLNRKASDWYRALDAEVIRALKLTKTYWRKARRRQDYDARADQDHMELHEWLQQLKDKTMSHLEVLMQKGDIQGPPYNMADDLELTFLKKFIERQAAGIPHNPRLRNPGGPAPFVMPHPSASALGDSPSPPSDSGYAAPPSHEHGSDSSGAHQSSRTSTSPVMSPGDPLSTEASSSKRVLQSARSALSLAQDNTRRTFDAYTAALEEERQARQVVNTAERRRDDVMAMIAASHPMSAGSRHSSPEDRDDSLGVSRYPAEPSSMRSWSDIGQDRLTYGTPAAVSSVFHDLDVPHSRKHARTWESSGPLHDTYASDELGMPPRKRVQNMLPFDQPSFSGQNLSPFHE